MKSLFLYALCALLLAACGPNSVPASSTPAPDVPVSATDSPTTNPTEESSDMPYAPKPEDANLSRGNVFIEEKGLLIRESYPPQVALGISGSLPNPCHELRAAIELPDVENKINVEVYTVVDPNMICTEVLKPFSQTIELGTFPNGHYSVWVNDEMVGEFDS